MSDDSDDNDQKEEHTPPTITPPQISINFEDISQSITSIIENVSPKVVYGHVTRVIGSLVKTNVKNMSIGEQCRLINPSSGQEDVGEVVGLEDSGAIVSPIGDVKGLSPRTRVIPTGQPMMIPVGPWLIGSVIDGMGKPVMLGKPMDPSETQYYPVERAAPEAMSRAIIDTPLPTGIRSIDSMLTCGIGQRVGIFGMAGCGKSSLMSMMTKGAQADVFVFGMIGERGREIREFIEHNLGKDGMAKSVMVVSTSDRPSIERMKAACVATTIAEYFRDMGCNVVLFIDSVTRYARALREIGLAAGEPPTRRGFPPSVFSNLPKLLERSGPAANGSITAFYTVLAEGDLNADPVAEETKSILDGHIVLSPKLGNSGHYPAIDVLASKSRLMNSITNASHIQHAGKVRELMSKYEEVELLLQVGEYKQGNDRVADEAVQKHNMIIDFLKQKPDDFTDYNDILKRLASIAA